MTQAEVTVHDRYSDTEIKAYYDAGFWSSATLYASVCAQADQHPDKAMLFDSTQSYTYAQLRDQGLRLAVGLRRLGVMPGDRVAVQVPNWAEFGLLVVAINRAGAVTVPIMTIYRHDEVGFVLEHSGAKVAVSCGEVRGFDHLAMFEDLRPTCPALESLVLVRSGDKPSADIVTLDDLLVAGDPVELAAELGDGSGPDDGFLIIYTSGTTSRPKGCFHTVNTLRATATAMAQSLDYTVDDVQFGPSPISHATGLLTNFLLPLWSGASAHLIEAWDPAEAMRRIAEHHCTVAVSATAFVQMMMAEFDPQTNDLSSMRFWVCAGSPIPGAIVEQARTMLSGGRVLSLYGRSENFLTTMCTSEDPPARAATSDGSALHGAEVRIVDVFGDELPRGEEGDIAYQGPSHMLQYYRDDEQTSALFTPDGYSRSGDLGRMDADGFVRVTGRLKDIVIRGGLNISAREIEELVGLHPGVASVAVVGYPDERLGEKVCVCVVPAAGTGELTLAAINDFLRARKVATQKLPERLEILSDLPMTATGKVRKHILRDGIATSPLA